MSTVLIIDDARIMRVVLKDILQKHCEFEKANIYEAAGGKDGIAQYKRVRPEVVLCDIKMLDMNGIDVVKYLMEYDPSAKIIMVTSSADKNDVRACMAAGAMDYIIKPPSVERVKTAIENIIHYTVTDDSPAAYSMPKKSPDITQDSLVDENAKLKEEIELLKKQLAEKNDE